MLLLNGLCHIEAIGRIQRRDLQPCRVTLGQGKEGAHGGPSSPLHDTEAGKEGGTGVTPLGSMTRGSPLTTNQAQAHLNGQVRPLQCWVGQLIPGK